jgi:SAM-dependent methyltransferase
LSSRIACSPSATPSTRSSAGSPGEPAGFDHEQGRWYAAVDETQPHRLIGVDQSPEMLARARARVRDAGWENVTLVESAADAMPAVGPVDRALIFYAHDVMRSPADLDRILAQVRPGGRVIAAGPRWAPWWAFPLSLWVWHIARPYHTTFEGFRRPWSHLAARTASLHVERTVFGRAYLAYIAVARVR